MTREDGEDGENVRGAEKVTLRRKLTGPPRLLLGKTRTRSVREDRPETRTNEDRTENTESSSEETANTDEEVSPAVESSGGRCGAAEEDDTRNRKTNRRRRWRRFSPSAVCLRKQQSSSAPPEGALQDPDTEETSEEVSKGRRTFNVRTFRRFLTSSDVQRTHKQERDEPSTTFRKKLRRFFTRGGQSKSSGVPLDRVENSTRCDEAPCSSAAQVEEPVELHSDATVGSPEVVTAERSVQLTQEPAESPDGTPTEEEQLVCDISVTEGDLKDAADGSDTIRTDSEVVEGPAEEVLSSETEVVLDADQTSARTSSPQKTDQTTSQSLQPSTNRPSIRIELVPPDELTPEDEEDEECWGNQNHLLLLLGFEPSEQQLLQTARSLVRAAVNAAVDQLTREQQSESDCVHREPPGCRDHA